MVVFLFSKKLISIIPEMENAAAFAVLLWTALTLWTLNEMYRTSSNWGRIVQDRVLHLEYRAAYSDGSDGTILIFYP